MALYHRAVKSLSRTLAFQVIGAAVIVNAMAGIFILLGSGGLSELEERIILTVVTLSFLGVGLLPAAVGWQRVRVENLPLLPALSAVFLIATALMILGALWLDLEDDSGGNIAFTLFIIGTAAAHLTLLFLARQSEVRLIASALTVLLAVLVSEASITDEPEPDWRLFGIVGILWFAASLLVPIRQWASGTATPPRAGIDAGPVRYCPYCGNSLGNLEDPPRCSGCGASFHVSAAP